MWLKHVGRFSVGRYKQAIKQYQRVTALNKREEETI